MEKLRPILEPRRPARQYRRTRLSEIPSSVAASLVVYRFMSSLACAFRKHLAGIVFTDVELKGLGGSFADGILKAAPVRLKVDDHAGECVGAHCGDQLVDGSLCCGIHGFGSFRGGGLLACVNFDVSVVPACHLADGAADKIPRPCEFGLTGGNLEAQLVRLASDSVGVSRLSAGGGRFVHRFGLSC